MSDQQSLLIEGVDESQPIIQLPNILEFDAVKSGAELEQKTVVLELHIRKPGWTKTLNAHSFVSANAADMLQRAETVVQEGAPEELSQTEGYIAAIEEQGQEMRNDGKPKVDAKLLHVTQDKIDRKEIGAISKYDDKFAEWIKARSLSCRMLASGLYLIKASDTELVDAAITEFVKARRKRVKLLGEKYTSLVMDAMSRSEFLTHDDFAPFSEIEPKYRVEAQYLSFNVPAVLEKINTEIYERAKKEHSLMWADAAQEVRDARRLLFKELTGKLADNFTADEKTGKRKSLHPSKVKKLQAFLDDFEANDFTDDKQLAAYVHQLRDLLNGVDPATLRTDKSLLEVVEAGIKKVAADLPQLVTVQTRLYNLQEDEEETGLEIQEAV